MMLFSRSVSLQPLALLALLFAICGASALRADHHEGSEKAAEHASDTEAAPMIMRYREGEHYQKVPAVGSARGDGIEVVEFFSYGCVHCFNFDPAVESWSEKLGDDVQFKRVPAVFNSTWEFLAQAFYTAEALGVAEEMHLPLFRAIHTDSINIGDPQLMAKLFADHGGIKAEDFALAFDAFSVRSKVQQSKAQGRAMRLRAVPSMVVGGQYVVDGSMLKGGNEEMLEVVDYLVGLMATERTMLEAASGD